MILVHFWFEGKTFDGTKYRYQKLRSRFGIERHAQIYTKSRMTKFCVYVCMYVCMCVCVCVCV